MVLYICKKCNKEFTRKSNYLSHTDRKYPCVNKVISNVFIVSQNDKNSAKKDVNSTKIHQNITNNASVDDLTCKYCFKVFARKDSLKKHISSRCKVKKQDDINKEISANELIEKNKLIEDNKLAEKYNKLLEEHNKLLKKQISKSKTCKKNIQNNVQNIQNNIQNNINIQITQFGKEDLKEIDDKHYLKIINDNKISGSKFITEMVKSIHFNPLYPRFHNIYISDINREKCMIYDGKDWKLLTTPMRITTN